MTIEQIIQENTEALRALTVILQSAGAIPAATAADTKTEVKTEKPAAAGKGKKAEDKPKAEDKKDEPKVSDFDVMKNLVTKLVGDDSKGKGLGKKHVMEVMSGYGPTIKNIQALFDLNKYDEAMGKLSAFYEEPAAEGDGFDL